MTIPEKRNYFVLLVIAVVVSGVVGGLAGFMTADSLARSAPFINRLENIVGGKVSSNQTSQAINNDSVVKVVDHVSPAIVSIIVSKDLPKINNQVGNSDFFRQFLGDDFDKFFGGQNSTNNDSKEKQEIGSGSGFIISKDGLVVTNRHVVADEAAEYTVVTNKGEKHTAKVLGRDPVNDLAVLKIEGDNFPTLDLGDSSQLKPGQSVIAIGNALGQFSNTVSTGVISGLARSIDAFSANNIGSERLIGLIQTDASINPGNSGGPLLDTEGKVIGINVAVAQNAQNIGFAIPINQVKATIDSVRQNGRLVKPFIGVRYLLITPEIAKAQKLGKDTGAWVTNGDQPNQPAIVSGSPADKAGIKDGDIILEVNGKKITVDNPLATIVSQAKPGDILELKIWRAGKEITVKVTLEEMKS